MVILWLKHINFTTIKYIFLEVVDIDEIVVSNNISSVAKSYKYFIGYLFGDYKVELLHIMLPKTSAYVKMYDGKSFGIYFLTENDDLVKKKKYME